ncbi:hypothetical protein HGRIS_000259 [Hohenbuehelia grisea]|uniref:L-ornithine N(5)-monooxygenase [NAD(P)H] n=1 Tax=Hohenbuehelia grisea TaxID=104357 RepID=A0ABR3JQI7_9AGAR
MSEPAPYLTVEESEFYDLVIIGNGPCALALSARLRERYPHPIYTDVEQIRFLFIRKHAGKISTRRHKTLSPKTPPRSPSQRRRGLKMVSVGSSASGWLDSWRAMFRSFGISFLRSPMFFHSHPDPDGLIAYAHATGRENELKEIQGVVGKERSKHQVKRKRGKKLPLTDINERDRKDYFRPSSHLFFDFCDRIVDDYGLHDNLLPAHGVDIASARIHVRGTGCLPESGMAIKLQDGRTIGAKAAVLAVGINSQPRLPDCIHTSSDHITHTGQIPLKGLVQTLLQSKIRSPQTFTRVLVIGGGLTSAQIVHGLVEAGVDQVVLVTRNAFIRVKDFDFNLDWAAKYKNARKAAFWNETDMEERWKIIGEARGGGSVNPEYWGILQRHIKAGRVELLTGACMEGNVWDEATQRWYVDFEVSPAIEDLDRKKFKELEGRQQDLFDHIYCATGSKPDIETLECMQSVVRSHPIDVCHGLPCLTEDLQWCEDVPLFVVGGFAALQVGPTAYNLEGGRACAERVALKLEDMFQLSEETDQAGYEDPRGGSFFSVLSPSGPLDL